MRARHLALAAVLLLSLAGCDVVNAQVSTIDKADLASDAAAQMAVSTAKIAIVSYLAANPGQLPATDELGTYGYQPTEGVTIAVAGSADDFCVQATSSTGSVYHSMESGSVEDGACS